MTSPLTYEQKWGTPEGKDSVDLCSSLPRWLGARLINLGTYTRGVPGAYILKFPRPDRGRIDDAHDMDAGYDTETALKQWRLDLVTHGKALLAYANAEHDADPFYDGAQAALRWCADHLENLWD